ncbi:hypothetical protein EDB81DRAFT_727833 [Dactylonectria macrodidyma]|uniref:Zn(2)-C6 fungal-type domain-containing protein n=1 Tax=Dactylonectria macrodidyma TaxID=307937 RepID=A0A9P9IQ28_9HYPO|nr:hypothetical protein EDB81DRAFT_727833 [Dactylonectria macrodidyma]
MVSSFRPLQPAAQQSPQHHNSVGPRGAAVASERLGKRIRSVRQACQDCRQSKVKCDGRRPRCGTCIAKERPCCYEYQSRRVAMKSRLQTLESLFYALQAKPGQEADRLLQQIRCTDNFRSLVGDSSSNSPGVSSRSSPTTGSEEQSLGSDTPVREIANPRLLRGSHVGDGAHGKAQVPTPSPTPRELSTDASTFLMSLVTSNASVAKAAVHSFFTSSGKLFHVFSREQVQSYYEQVLGSDGCPIPSQKTAVCCLAAVAAVGVQYNADDFEVGMDGVFYDVAKHFFETLMEEQPLDAIKACTMLAMYNIMNKATVSLAYIEVGLGMSKRHNLKEKSCHYPGLSPEDWVDYRRTWRTLLWLSSTLGYISGSDLSFREVVPLTHGPFALFRLQYITVVQTEITKIALLNADILRMHLSSKELTSQSMDSVNKDIQHWHNELPSQMHLTNICRQDLPLEARRSILGTHLLYLGTTMLLYRRITSQFVRSSGIDHGHDIMWKPFEKTFLSHADQAMTAARHSARILSLLQAEQGIFKRCWLIIFQSFTSCVVLLHSIAQKQLHQFSRSSWEDDLVQARICLDILSFCSTTDSVALKFQDCLVPIYDKLASYIHPTASTSTLQNPSSLNYLLNVPKTADADRVSLSLKLLMMLCQPFGDAIGKCSSNNNLGEPLDWGLENCLPFRWDSQDVGIGDLGLLETNNRFLGSDEPSGWTGVQSEDGSEELEWTIS